MLSLECKLLAAIEVVSVCLDAAPRSLQMLIKDSRQLEYVEEFEDLENRSEPACVKGEFGEATYSSSKYRYGDDIGTE